ncbi:hypothetical protein FDZ58_00600 [Ehrlichia ruminantium]|uniref:Uncharacterized protein n=1 Tax=Ehrlichia ruminantium (strain Welgevonden) TaxID=254945 RepID=A0A0H3M7J6_EHRRW|nr:hypothetical protein [Ehrlichia ruminantium]KYW92291.1 hypothetical protein AUR40_02845 [Ehrlichia ruminantium]QLK50183.1 hypothetical protein FDZ68_00600 [Ehrlichia ruminantium]QLK51108.1 hypothetical protein FDZ66_00605 [Ehrlichia ruminantium]QLK52941.1 hypothetical protein FDZ64_00595 [Ehrlichia ruminantium]QLK54779.1 hypothetical protein FDZ62_00615 [Ehrlichia ruminantium]
MLDGDKSRLIERTVNEYDELYKRNKGSFSVKDNMLLDVFLYMFLIMNICCIVILSNHSSFFVPVFSGKLGLFNKNIPLCFSIALVAIVPITILFLVLLCRKYKVQSVKHSLVDKGVIFTKHLADYVRDLEINSRRIDSVIASLRRELDTLIIKQNELSEMCESRVNGFDLQLQKLTEDTKCAVAGVAARFANSDSQIQELSSRLQRLCADSKNSSESIERYVSAVGNLVQQQVDRFTEKAEFLKQLYRHLTVEVSSLNELKDVMRKCVEYVENKPHLKKSARRFLSNSKIWNICSNLKELLSRAEQGLTSEDLIINWAQDIVKILDKYKLNEFNEEDLSSCKDDEERSFVKNLLFVEFPILQINTLRLVVNMRQEILKRSCAAAQGFAESIISSCTTDDSVVGSGRLMPALSVHTAGIDDHSVTEGDDDYSSREVMVEHMTSKTHKSSRPTSSL